MRKSQHSRSDIYNHQALRLTTYLLVLGSAFLSQLVESSSSTSTSYPTCSSGSIITTSSGTSNRLDLSYLPHVSPSTLRKAIQTHAAAARKHGQNICVNLGHASALGDDRLKEIIGKQGLTTTMMTNNLMKATITQLDLSMNHLTSVGVAWLLQEVSIGQPLLQSLTLDWNNLASDHSHKSIVLHDNLEKLIGNKLMCPTELSFCQCSLDVAFCRAMGQGLMHRYLDDINNEGVPEHKTAITASQISHHHQVHSMPQPLSLSLCGNPNLGDAGIAAIAAALRTIFAAISDRNETCTVLRQLNLSACGISDTGAAALALALSEDGCGGEPLVLDLSHNQITDEGVAILGRSIAMAPKGSSTVQTLDLTNNEVGVSGCTALLVAMARGKLETVILRSCNIHADVAGVIGKGLREIIFKNSSPFTLEIDLSGNPLGVFRGKKKKEGSKYSASQLKSTATATAASYMNLLKKGLREVGMDTMLGVTAPDSDDEDEKLTGEEKQEEESEFTRLTCGAKSLVNAFLDDSFEKLSDSSTSNAHSTIRLGLRSCFFDHEAAGALAALVVKGRDQYGVDILLDVRMNPVLEDEMVGALCGSDSDRELLNEMAERHLDVLEAIKEAEERAQEARYMANARNGNYQRTEPSLSDDDEDSDNERDDFWDSISVDDDFVSP